MRGGSAWPLPLGTSRYDEDGWRDFTRQYPDKEVDHGDDPWWLISSVTPSSGQLGTIVALSGQRMLGGGSTASVTLAGVAAQVISAGASTTIVVAQSSGSTGVGDVQIVSDTGAVVTLSNGFDYETAGVITTVSPPSGQVGTIVTITGTTLRGSAD